MGKATGFLAFERQHKTYEAPLARVKHYKEFVHALSDENAKIQGARCMDCGIPFCNNGCPVNNIIPDFNDLVFQQNWKTAIQVLHAPNNSPEFTGRICPAPCEAACTLGINDDPVGIKSIEHAIIDKAWAEGWVAPQPPKHKTGKKVAVVGSGPAGLAAAQQLARAGYDVTVFEKNDRIGGLLRYGIPDFKLEKRLIDRRRRQMEAEGVTFRANVFVGKEPLAAHIGNTAKETVTPDELKEQFDAVVIAGGSETPRELPVPGRELAGIHFAMEFLPQQNKVCSGDQVPGQILATGKHVVIIGGGDTGADCLGTSHRQKAASVHQFEIMPMPPADRAPQTPWPLLPLQLRVESSHEEGGKREWAVETTRFTADEAGNVRQLHSMRVGPPPKFEPIPG